MLAIIVVVVLIVGAFFLGWKVGDKVAAAVGKLFKNLGAKLAEAFKALWVKFVALFKKK